jgi:predicted GNAT family N-acyltransferase
MPLIHGGVRDRSDTVQPMGGQSRVGFPGAGEFAVVELSAAETHPLRMEVLRADTPSRVVTFDGDDRPDTVHLGVRHGDTVIAVSTWIPTTYHGEPAVQLRGMATAKHLQAHGVGAVLLESGCARAAKVAPLVWARARDAALDFYLRHGFAVDGDGFIDETTQLPHHLIVRRLA